MHTAPAVSVILPFHNAAHTLPAAVESICKQTFPNWELILYNDGAGDGSGSIAEQYARRDPRIRVAGGARVGIVGALQRACDAARGEFIARMDADDISHPERFARQLELMWRDNALALCGCQVRATGVELGEGGQRYYEWINGLVDHALMEREMFVECPIAHPTFFMRRSVFVDAGGYQDHGWAEDYDLVLRLWRLGARFAKVPETLLDWRNAPDRLSLTDSRYSLDRFRALKRCYLEATVLEDLGARRFIQWGAGEVGKRWLREWEGVRPESVVDIHPRKVGTRIHGFPVIAPEELQGPGRSYLLIAVGAPGARDEIRAWLEPRGYREVEDYRFIA